MKNPNIIIIVVDAFRPKNLSLFGYEKETDKNIKKISKESLLFRQHFSTSNSTAPSLTSLFTGRFPSNHGIIHQLPYTEEKEIEKLKKEKFWLPIYLRDKGYNTIAMDWIGLWFKRGFSYYEEKEEKQSKARKFLNIELIKKILLGMPNWMYALGKKIIKTRSSADMPPASTTIELAIKKINESKEQGKPFFLFTHLWDTHFPFKTTKFQKTSEKNDIPEILAKIESNSQKEYIKKRIVDIDLHSIKDITDKYDTTLANVDYQIGKLADYLKKEKLWDNTIFIIMGDHGDSISEHNIYFSHSGLFDESIHVPLVMHIPGIKPQEINEFVQNTDLAPTILDVLGEKNIPRFDGKSLVNLAKTGKKIRDMVFSWDGLSKDIVSVRTKKRKLIVAKDNKCHLCKASHHKNIEEYDLINDPSEQKNIYSGKSELKKYLK